MRGKCETVEIPFRTQRILIHTPVGDLQTLSDVLETRLTVDIRFFKMQLSEVIVHTRELFRDVTGKDKVMALEHVTPEQIEQRLHIDKDQEEYKKFLSGMDYDKKG